MAARPGIALVLVGACAVLAIVRTQPPAPQGAEAPTTEFSAARGMETLRRVLGDGAPHPVGTAAHEKVRERILTELRAIGLEPTVEESAGVSVERVPRTPETVHFSDSPSRIAVARNVVARIPGAEDSKAVLLCAHYDSVAAGAGAGDDGSGVATLLEVARALKSGPPLRRPVVVLLDDAEECGLLGAQAYVARHPVRDEIEVVVNCDARGTEGPTFLFETSYGNEDLVGLYARAVDRPCGTSAAYEVYKRMPNSTDLSVYKSVGLAGLNFAFIGGLRRYHTARDDLAHLSAASLQHEGDQVLAVARALATEDFRAKTDGNLVYADVIGLFLLRWPASRSIPAAIVLLLAVLGVASSDLRKRTAAVGRGLLLALATIAGSAAIAPAIAHGIEILRGHPEPWVGHPAPFLIAIVSGAVVVGLLLARAAWLARAGFEGSWAGIWIPLAIAGVASAATVPGASYLFLAPCALAVVSRLSRKALVATAVPACGLVLLWVPLAIGLEQAVELKAPIALGLPIGILLASAGLAWTAADDRWILRAAIVALAGSIAWAAVVPTSTVDRPAWITLAHVEEVGKDGARLFALNYGAPLPSELRAMAPFSTSPECAFPEIARLPEGFVAPTAVASADAARIEVLATRTEADARIVDVRFSSPRAAPCLVLHLRGLVGKGLDEGVLSAKLGELTVLRPIHQASFHTRPDGSKEWECDAFFFGAPPEGVVLTLRAPLDRPAELLLLDVVYGLPPGDAKFAEARPENCVQSSPGDQWVVARRLEL